MAARTPAPPAPRISSLTPLDDNFIAYIFPPTERIGSIHVVGELLDGEPVLVEVRSIGPGRLQGDGSMKPCPVAVGQIAAIDSESMVHQIRVGEDVLAVIKASDVLAICEASQVKTVPLIVSPNGIVPGA